MKKLIFSWVGVSLILSFAGGAAAQADWPMFGADLKRTSYTTIQVDPPIGNINNEATWVRDFFTGDANTADLIANNCQPIIVGKRVFVATLRNRVHALDTSTGAINWTTQLPEEGMVVVSPSAMNDVLYVVSTNGYIYLLDISNGNVITKNRVTKIGGFQSSPAPTPGAILVGGEDGMFYALDPSTGAELWSYDSGAPIVGSCAVDEAYGRVYFSNEDMYGFALDTGNGNLIWKTNKFNGVTTEGYFPVIIGDGQTAKIIFRTSPGVTKRALEGGDSTLLRAAGHTTLNDDSPVPEFYHYLAWANDPTINLSADPGPGDLENEDTFIDDFLINYSAYRTWYTINALDGTETIDEPPILWQGGSGYVGEPPVVDANGNIYTRTRSFYSDYDVSNMVWVFGQPAIVDLDTNTVSQIPGVDNHNAYGTGIYIIADECVPMIMGGNRLYILSHGDSVGSILNPSSSPVLERIVSARDFPHNIGFGSNPSRKPYVPFGIGDAVDNLPQSGSRFIGNGGGASSINGLGMSIGDDKLFYVSQGMLGMYEQNGGGINYIYDTWTEPAFGNVTVPSQAELESYVINPAIFAGNSSGEVISRIEAEVSDLIGGVVNAGWSDSNHYQPYIHAEGKGNVRHYFKDPTTEAYALGISYAFVSSPLKQDIITYVQTLFNNIDPLTTEFAQHKDGKRRERWDFTNDLGDYLLGINVQQVRDNMRLYNIWAYAHYTGDWSWVENNWGAIESQIPATGSENNVVANLIGGYRMAVHMNDSDADTYLGQATAALRDRLQWEQDNYPPTTYWMRQSDPSAIISTSWGGGSEINRYHALTYEVGKALYDYGTAPMTVVDKFFRSSASGMYLYMGWGVLRGEYLSIFPHQQRQIWAHKIFVMQPSFEDLSAYTGAPWCEGDLYYMERLAWLARAGDINYSSHNPADISEPFGCIDMGELTAYINRWLQDSQDVTMPELMGAVTLWRSGEGCG